MSSIVNTLEKTAATTRDYPLDWQPYLGPSEKVVTSSWSSTPAGLTIGAGGYAPTIDSDGKGTVVWLSGGTPGASYVVTNHIITDNVPAREESRSIAINVEGSPILDIGEDRIDLAQYGGDKTGVLRVEDKVQSAIDALYGTGGGTLYIPRGTWRFSLTNPTTITVKPGVTIDGPERVLSMSTLLAGALTGAYLNVYGVTKLFTMQASSRVRNLEIFYPNQDPTAVTPTTYDWTFFIDTNQFGASVENITAVNPYRLYYNNAAGGLLRNVWGLPISRGVNFVRNADIVRAENVHFGNVQPANPLGSNQRNWIQANGRAFSVDGSEEFNFSHCFAYGYHQGLAFEDEDGDAFKGVYGSWIGGGLDICDSCVIVLQPNGLTLRGLKMSDCSLIPNAGGAVWNFADTAVPANPDQNPSIYADNISVHSSHTRSIQMQANSRGRMFLSQSSLQGFTSEGANVAATAYVNLSRVGMAFAATRTAGAGTIVDAGGWTF